LLKLSDIIRNACARDWNDDIKRDSGFIPVNTATSVQGGPIDASVNRKSLTGV